MKDPRYQTAAWRKVRRHVIAAAGGLRQVRGPRCTGYADTCDHIIPTSQWPEGFWDLGNLRASCRRCNYGRGSSVAHENNRRTLASLRQQVLDQQTEIDQLRARLAQYEIRTARQRVPAIY